MAAHKSSGNVVHYSDSDYSDEENDDIHEDSDNEDNEDNDDDSNRSDGSDDYKDSDDVERDEEATADDDFLISDNEDGNTSIDAGSNGSKGTESEAKKKAGSLLELQREVNEKRSKERNPSLSGEDQSGSQRPFRQRGKEMAISALPAGDLDALLVDCLHLMCKHFYSRAPRVENLI